MGSKVPAQPCQNPLQLFFCLFVVVAFFRVLNVGWPGEALSGIGQTLEVCCTGNWGRSEHCCGRSFKRMMVQEVACVPLPEALV